MDIVLWGVFIYVGIVILLILGGFFKATSWHEYLRRRGWL